MAVLDMQKCRHGCTGECLACYDEDIARLRGALEQLLDDMGEDGHCVCEAAKQQAIAAMVPNNK